MEIVICLLQFSLKGRVFISSFSLNTNNTKNVSLSLSTKCCFSCHFDFNCAAGALFNLHHSSLTQGIQILIPCSIFKLANSTTVNGFTYSYNSIKLNLRYAAYYYYIPYLAC